jgi:hypothetical protein
MPDFPSVFPLWWIGLTAVATGLAGLAILCWRLRELSWIDTLRLAPAAGLSVLAWRLAGNIAELNDDPLPPFSPNDWLCPAITFVFLSVYGAFHRPLGQKRRELARALLTIISLVVNGPVI